jgi:ParB-like chromosome segregation protein Spo0J
MPALSRKQEAVAFPPHRIERVDVLTPYARNARTHSDEQIARIADSIREFGFTNPVLIDGDQGIVAGHGRVLAAKKLGMTEVPVIELSHLTPAQRRAYVLADNKLALDAGWDKELLRGELSDLRADGFDLALAGFGGAELKDLLGDDAEESAEPGLDALRYQVVVECADEMQQAALLEEFDAKGLKAKPLTL